MSKQAMTFEEIEDCYPDGASVNEYGEIIVSAQWLHDFARKVGEAIKQHDAEPVAWMSPSGNCLSEVDIRFDGIDTQGWTPLYLSAPSTPEGFVLAPKASVEWPKKYKSALCAKAGLFTPPSK